MQEIEEQQYWLGLHLIPQFGNAKLAKLLARIPSAAELWREPDDRLLRLDLPQKLLRQFIAGRQAIDLPRELDKVRQCGAHIVSFADPAYPRLLREIADRPLVLYVRGKLPEAEAKTIAVVGTRKPSKYGWDAARTVSQSLAQHNVTIVSGLAHGIDSAAHRGALEGGRTIAVMATGIDRVYPADNAELAEQIASKGALVTEMPLGTAPLGKNFPQRNRIISGMSLGVLVAEAPEKSGALNTVSHAIDQGRDVFALPHNIFSKTGRGSNALIQDGAKLVMRVSDVLQELNMTHLHTQARIETERVHPENDMESLIMQQLGADPIHIDVIVRQTNLSTATVSSSLTMLELKGLAETAGPMQYCRAR
ncbi:MAG: DNA-processing protein DprA [Chloroflexota bacterium]|nr:DNA-processing protein DprA [Chloroflexota bacterium]